MSDQVALIERIAEILKAIEPDESAAAQAQFTLLRDCVAVILDINKEGAEVGRELEQVKNDLAYEKSCVARKDAIIEDKQADLDQCLKMVAQLHSEAAARAARDSWDHIPDMKAITEARHDEKYRVYIDRAEEAAAMEGEQEPQPSYWIDATSMMRRWVELRDKMREDAREMRADSFGESDKGE